MHNSGDYDPKKQTYPPEWFQSQPFWRYFRHYADYVRRAGYLNSQGRHVARVALYYPLETAFANAEPLLASGRWDLLWNNPMDHTQNVYSALQLELARRGWSYHILDAEYLRRAEVSGKRLRIAGEEFTVMLLPPLTDIAPSSVEKLKKFIAAGGTVIALGDLPEGLPAEGIRRFPVAVQPPFMDRLDYLKPVETPAAVRAGLEPALAALRAVEAPEIDFGADADRLYASHRTGAGADWYWVVNDSDAARRASGRFPRRGRYEKWDAETGARTALCEENGRLRLEFEPWGAFFVVRTGGATPRCAPPAVERTLAELPREGWRFTPEAEILRVPYAAVEGGTEPVWLAAERLSNGRWWLAGPYPYADHAGFFQNHPPETVEAPESGGGVRWTWHESPTYFVTLRNAFPEGRREGIFYAFAHVYSPLARRGRARVAFADSVQLFWNGERRLSEHRHQKFSVMRDVWAESVPVEIRQGWNRVLLKIESGMNGPTMFMFRVVDERGDTMRDLVYAQDRTTMEAAPPRPLRMSLAVPPGATAVKHPFTGAWSALAAGVRTWPLTSESGALPERAVEFRPGTAAMALESWTDSALANYSGVARYEIDFELPRRPAGQRVLLDLGSVGLAAEVWLNGTKAGERVWRPFRVDITRLARAGRNTLLVRVANSSAGWESQGDTLYAPGAWGLRYRTERDRLGTLRPNGLEGPVRVIGVTAR